MFELLRRNRHNGTVRPAWTDRRTDLYSVRYSGSDDEPRRT